MAIPNIKSWSSYPAVATVSPTASILALQNGAVVQLTPAGILASAGQVSGPASSTVGDIATFSNATGTVIQDSGILASSIMTNSLANGKIFIGNAGGVATAQTVSGDATLSNAGALTVTKTNGVSFAASATTDTTVATNITSGTLPSGRISGSYTSLTGVGTLTAGTWNASVITGTYGGTGVNNGSSTITVGGNVTFSGAFTTTITVTAGTSVTLPTSGTLVNTGVTTLSSLTSVGTIGTGVWQGSIIAGAYGGTNNGFLQFAGPASSLKTYTGPNASCNLLTDNALVTVAQGGIGVGTLTGIAKGNGTSAFTAATAGTDYVAPGTATSFTAQQNFGAAALTDASPVAWNLATQQFATLLMTSAVGATRQLQNPSNLVNGGTYILKVTQSSTGSNALTYGTAYKFPGGTVPVLSTANNAVDILTFVSDGTSMFGVAQKAFS